jgi:hypothetical protein
LAFFRSHPERRPGSQLLAAYTIGVDQRPEPWNMTVIAFFTLWTLFLDVPIEFGRAQRGNNNAYCQDSEISWLGNLFTCIKDGDTSGAVGDSLAWAHHASE